MDSFDPFDLDRFVKAQSADFQRATNELRAGRKQSHWIWYIFPQLKGLGESTRSQRYGIQSIEEARAYLAHPVLGSRLLEVTDLVMAHKLTPLQDILGSPDDMKFRSSMTLFSVAAEPGNIFSSALEAFCDGKPDMRTLALLGSVRACPS